MCNASGVKGGAFWVEVEWVNEWVGIWVGGVRIGVRVAVRMGVGD